MTGSLTLDTLIAALPDLTEISRDPDAPPITAPVSEDSRSVKPGGLFVARKGSSRDGHDLIPEAVQAGAVAVIGERAKSEVDCTVAYLQVGNAQRAIGLAASAYYGYPSRELTVIGVTGTDGKTTTSNLIYNILKAAGIKVGMISTVSAVIGDQELPTGLHVTTPGADEVQMYLRRMVDAGLTHCMLETTSHGLAQYRVHGVDYDIAVLTNITHEHLDFHGTFDHYREAKGRLFGYLGTSHRKVNVPKIAVINADSPEAGFFGAYPADRRIYYTLDRNPAEVRADSWKFTPSATEINILVEDQPLTVTTRMVGAFNIENVLAAVSACTALHIPFDAIRAGIANMPPVPGRMERIDAGQDFLAIVDFAHTPNALDRALTAARTLINDTGRVICVFGCAGLRDREKRRLMPEAAIRRANFSVFTAEDPRTEDLNAILEVMAQAAIVQGGEEGRDFIRVPDRGRALLEACRLARPGDVVIACGKGHEQSMAFGTTEYAWDDRAGLRAALTGTPLLTLPTADQNLDPNT